MAAPPPIAREDIERLYVTERKTLQQTAEALGCSLSRVQKTMKRFGIPRRPPSVQPPRIALADIEATYLATDSTLEEAAATLGCTKSQLVRVMQKLNIPRKPGHGTRRYPLLYEPGWLEEQLKTKSCDDIAREFGMTRWAVFGAAKSRRLRSAVSVGDSIRKAFAEGRRPRPDPSKLKLEDIRAAYVDDEKATMRSAARRLGCSQETLRRALALHGLATKPKTRHAGRLSAFVQLDDREWLTKELETKPIRQIARELGTSVGNVGDRVRRYGLSVPDANRVGLNKRFPQGRFGQDAGNWKGGRRDSPGMTYVHIYRPEHPHAMKSGYVLEHRLVMEGHLGRYLEEWEEVHHKNGNKKDNRIENLEVTDRRTHVQRHYEAVKHVERLEAENARLKAENTRLKARLSDPKRRPR